MIASAIYEKHRFGTGQTGYMGIVEPLSKSGNAISKSTIFTLFVLHRHLNIRCSHPAYRSSCRNLVTQGSKHPCPIGSHRATHTSYPGIVNLRKRSQKICTRNIVIGHKGRQVAPEHHHIATYYIIFAAVNTLFAPTLSPHRSISRKHDITVLCKIIASILSIIKLFHPTVSIIYHHSIHINVAHHFLLTYKEMPTMIMQHIYGRKGSLAIRNKKICRYARISIYIKENFSDSISFAFLLTYHLHIISRRLHRWSHHTLEHLCLCHRFPLGKVLDVAISPRQWIGKFLFQLFHISGQVEGKLIVFSFLQWSFLLLGKNI